jgi:hypothetical protein
MNALMPPAVMADVLHHLSHTPPAIVSQAAGRRSIVPPGTHEQIDRAREIERVVRAELARDQQLRDELWALWHSQPATPLDLAMLSETIGQVEARTGEMEKAFRRMAKIMRTSWKMVRELSPEAAKELQAADEGVITAARDQIEARKDFALFLRALRAEAQPSEPGPTFDSADELEAYLTAAVNA